jgi:hypothetical protein
MSQDRSGVNSKDATMESSTGMNSGLDVNSNPGLAPAAVPSVPSETANEKIFRQSEVNDLIGRAKREAVEKDRRMRVEQPEYAQQKYGDAAPTQNNAQTPYQSQSNNEDHIRKIVADETQRQREAWDQQTRQKTETEQAQAIVNKFWNKISPGKEKYQDFEKVTGDIEFGRFPNTVQILADHVENSADVLYELGKDRFKMAQLESLSYMSPKDAIIQAQRLANSIKENEQANEPLSQLRPSMSGTDGSAPSFRDLRAKYRG